MKYSDALKKLFSCKLGRVNRKLPKNFKVKYSNGEDVTGMNIKSFDKIKNFFKRKKNKK